MKPRTLQRLDDLEAENQDLRKRLQELEVLVETLRPGWSADGVYSGPVRVGTSTADIGSSGVLFILAEE